MSGHRRAAVALHGLDAKDQQWMLSELPEPDQRILRGYLDELDALGFSYGPDMADDFQSASTPAQQPTQQPLQTPSASSFADSAVEQVRQASAAQMLACLRDEPGSVIASLMSLHAWPWQEGLLALLPGARRQHIQSLLANCTLADGTPAASMAQEFLLNAVAGRLRVVPVSSTEIALAPRIAAGAAPKARRWSFFGAWRMPWNR